MSKSKVPTLPPYIFNVYKPAGLGSSDVVRHFKYHMPTGFGKIGHLGTLDPFAEGVLLIAIAGASRLSDLLHDHYPKIYNAVGRLGSFFDTGDTTGQPISECSEETLLEFDLDALNTCANSFVGSYLQTPPMYSATKHNGKPLYKYAREGLKIDKKPVLRRIHHFRVLEIKGRDIFFECSVSSGTYIRVLFEDFCKKLNTSGALSSLKRTNIGPFTSSDSIKKSLWPQRGDQSFLDYLDAWGEAAKCPGRIFSNFQHRLSEKDWVLFKNGRDIPYNVGEISSLTQEDVVALYSPSGRVSGLANFVDNKLLPFMRFSPFLE